MKSFASPILRRTGRATRTALLVLGAALFAATALAAAPAVVERNLFSPDRKPPAPPAPAAAPKVNLSGLQQLQVKGIMVMGTVRRAVLEGPNAVLNTGQTPEPGRLTVIEGDEVAGFKVDRIDGTAVVFKGEGVTHSIPIFNAKKKVEVPKAALTAATGRGRAAMVLPWQTASAPGPAGPNVAGPGGVAVGGGTQGASNAAAPDQASQAGVLGAQAALVPAQTERAPLVVDKTTEEVSAETAQASTDAESAALASVNTQNVYIYGGGSADSSGTSSGSSSSGSSSSGSSSSGSSSSGSSGTTTGSGQLASNQEEFTPPQVDPTPVTNCVDVTCANTKTIGNVGGGTFTPQAEMYSAPITYNPFAATTSGNPLGL